MPPRRSGRGGQTLGQRKPVPNAPVSAATSSLQNLWATYHASAAAAAAAAASSCTPTNGGAPVHASLRQQSTVSPAPSAGGEALAMNSGSSSPHTRSAPQGFAYLSPGTLAAGRTTTFPAMRTSASASPPSPSSQTTQQQQPHQPQRTDASMRPPTVTAHNGTLENLVNNSPAESSLARLRALAAPATVPSPTVSLPLLQNEESPLQQPPLPSPASASSSEPATPYTPDLVRRLSALNGTSFTQSLAVLHTDRLKRYRLGATPSAATDESIISPRSPLTSMLRNEEEEPNEERDNRQRKASSSSPQLRPALPPLVSSARLAHAVKDQHQITSHLENEEAVVGSRSKPARADPPSSVTSSSLLGRLRAAAAPAPLMNALASPPASPTPDPAGTSPWAPAIQVAVGDRLAQLRQRASASPAVNGHSASPAVNGNNHSSTTHSPTFPPTSFMNLERMGAGRGSAADGQRGPFVAPLSSSASSLSPSLQPHNSQQLSYRGIKEVLDHVPPYQLLAQSNGRRGSHSTSNDGRDGPSERNSRASASPPPGPSSTAGMPVAPTSVDGPLQGLQELNAFESQLRRYQTIHPTQQQPANGTATKRTARRSLRRQSATAAKKESAVATLVKGRRSTNTNAAGAEATHKPGARIPWRVKMPNAPINTDLEGMASQSMPSRQMVNRLRQLAAPAPIGEGTAAPSTEANDPKKNGSGTGDAVSSSASTLPPSWSSSAPFAALASTFLYDRISDAAAAQRRASAATTNATGSTDARAAAGVSFGTASSSSVLAGLRQSSGSSTLRGDAAVAQSPTHCVVFDTSSLLDSEPGVLNLLLERAHIGIPFTVLDELDHMHKERGNGAVGGENAAGAASIRASAIGSTSSGGVVHDREWRRKRAHDLRNWIAACLNKADTHLLLQKRTEVVDAYDRHTFNNDDQILGYAVYLQRHREKVLFVTEDKFLRIKAASELGKAYSYAEVRQLVGMPGEAHRRPAFSRAAKKGRARR